MNWIASMLMAWDFRRGYWHQPYTGNSMHGIDWMTWCGGGPLDNEDAR